MFINVFTVTALLAAAPAIAKQPDAAQQQASMCAQGCRTRSWIMTRRDNPDSTVVEDEKAQARRSPTNEEINAAETGNVESSDFRYSNLVSTAFSTGDLDLQALEAESPDNPQPGRTAASRKCLCMPGSAARAPAGGER